MQSAHDFVRRFPLYGSLFSLVAALLVLPPPAEAQPPQGDPEPWVEETVSASIQVWDSAGRGEWGISFSDTDPYPYSGKSRLKFDDLKSTLAVFSARVKATPWLRFTGSYGSGDIKGGTTTDGDWITIPSYGYKDFYFSESKSDTNGTVTLYDINALFRVYPWLGRTTAAAETYERPAFGRVQPPPPLPIRSGPRGVAIDLFAGFQSYEDDLTMTNGVQTVVDERSVYSPFGGLNSKYAFEWKAYRAGAVGTFPIGRNFEIRASYALIFGEDYHGEAFWNLRTDFRSTPPNFTHDADNGSGEEFRVSLSYHPTRLLVIEAGYWSITLKAEKGIDKVYLADGSTITSTLDDVTSKREGAFVGVGVKF